MKIGINLYQESLKPKVYYLTLNNIAIVTVLALALLGAWFGNLYMEQADIAKKIVSVERDQGFATTELENYQKAIEKHNDTVSFNQKKLKLERDIRVKDVLLKTVAYRDKESSVDYFKVMKDLTEHHDHELWLTEFRFNENEVKFDGFATQSNSVTRWLTYLQATDSFKGREFNYLSISAIDENVLQFQAATSASLFAQEIE